MGRDVKAEFQQLFNPNSFSYKNNYSRNIAAQIHSCHTKQRGYHVYQCDNEQCQDRYLQYHSCGNRHCPFCGSMKKEQWVEERIQDLLPCPYYHMVFTIPHDWNQLMMQYPKVFYKTLFDASSQTLLTLAKEHSFLGATPGITAVLHTWGQSLDYHVHLHCIISGGGIKNGEWVEPKRANGKFLFPIAMIQKVYKATFLRLIREARHKMNVDNKLLEALINLSGKKKWKVYAKAPFGGPELVIKYLGRYTHKTAISHQRIREVTKDYISFSYTDYRDNKKKVMKLTHHEFLRRFELHFLPKRFVRIRHYGLLRNRGKKERMQSLRKNIGLVELNYEVKLPMRIRLIENYGIDICQCKKCKTGSYELLMTKRGNKITYFRPRDGPVGK